MRQLRLRMSDETVRSVMVDENQPVANLMVIICTKLGITNHDEYSLIATGKHTINGRRKERLDGKIIDQKMEQLKKKLKTDEDLAWVDHSKTLDEQEIHEQDVVLLRRRFFYSDQNVDSRDPIQLGLLFVQTRDAILSGTHPVTLDGACKFAGIQCQAQLGDFIEGKTTRPNYFLLKDYLPADYCKQRQVERKIWFEHKKYYGLSELEAKARYVSEARSLPTYGVTFFLVKEKVPGKNKLVPRLLGITKDCVMRVDADSKAILKTWPLTTVKRWAASTNSFTLDFGDYSDSYYSIQTIEGEQISQLIAGYIDIILKRRKAKDHFGIEGDEGATMIEDSVAPSRATIIQNQPAMREIRPPSQTSMQDLNASVPGPTVQKMLREEGPFVEPPDYRPAVEVRGKAEIGYESRPLTQYVTNYELSLPQRDLQDRLEHAQDAVEEAQKILDTSQQTTGANMARQQQQYSSLRSSSMTTSQQQQQVTSTREVEQKKRKLSNQFAEINAATAELVSLSAIPEEELNYPTLNQAVETVAQCLPTVARDVKIVAALMEDDETGKHLIDAARRLCKAFSDLLNAAEPGPTVPRQSLISAASRVGDATQALLYSINNQCDNGDDEEDRETADILLGLAKSVASLAASLVLKAKDVANTCQDKELEDRIIGSATQSALATSQMVATAKIVAPTIHDLNCQRKLLDSCREVQRAVEGIQSACRDAIRDEQLLCNLNDLVSRVYNALDDINDFIRTIKRTTITRSQQQQHRTQHTTNQQQQQKQTSTTTVTHHKIHDESSGRLLQHEEEEDTSRKDLVDQARNLARVTAQLIQDITPVTPTTSNNQQYNHHHHHHHSSSEQFEQQQQRQQPVYDRSSDHHYTSQQQRDHHQNQYQTSYDQQEQQQQQRQQKTTTTITTTVYDEERLSNERPVSMYDTESGSRYISIDNSSSLLSNQNQNDNTQQQQRTSATTSQLHNSSEPEQQQHQLPEAATISGIIADLETTIVFATAGSLRAAKDNDNYLAHRENVLLCAKALVEDTRPLVTSAASNEQQLAKVAQESVATMSRLAQTVKASAASLGSNNSDSQVSLIRSVKNVACSLSDLINSTKSALNTSSNNNNNDNNNDEDEYKLQSVKDSAKTMVSSVTNLLKTVKSVEDEQQLLVA